MSRFGDIMAGIMGRRPPALQVAALCHREREGVRQVLLITSRGTGRWVIPKGWPMRGRSMSGAAAQEAWEEAGVKGRIETDPFGSYHYDKILDSGLATPVTVAVYRLELRTEHEDFPEANERQRRWFGLKEASKLVDEPELQKLIRHL